jgi:Thioredoxin
MIGFLEAITAAALLCEGGATPNADPREPAIDSTYAQLFAEGQSFADFLAGAERRKDQWQRNHAAAVVPDALLTRARAVPGPWKLLVVAVDGCSDSVNTIPYLARLVERLVGVEMRIIGADAGRAIMDAHPTPDGRGATPTVLLLNDRFEEKGCWVERPAELQTWILGQRGKAGDSQVFDYKMKWYEDDKGLRTLQDLVAMMEKAARGERGC